ncbi:hypothetical protein CAEBREN_03576 [Caenorhabditis brenneri]|uniref:Uncharacterized protein n=1 Tax=Caenorhabditis brenneri TaxID=135651 RepID=G0N882_CAEBE|nr:hypothetical protein CAEBREN_03576 [Caenorhabditis brenneri]
MRVRPSKMGHVLQEAHHLTVLTIPPSRLVIVPAALPADLQLILVELHAQTHVDHAHHHVIHVHHQMAELLVLRHNCRLARISRHQKVEKEKSNGMDIPSALGEPSNRPNSTASATEKAPSTSRKRRSMVVDEIPFPEEPVIDNPLQETNSSLTASLIQNLDVRGAIFRGLKSTVVAKLNERSLPELFNENQAGTPVIFAKSTDDISSIVVVEGTHRFSSIRSRLLNKSELETNIAVKIVVVSAAEFDDIWRVAHPITYIAGVDSKEKAHLEKLPVRVTRFLRKTFSNESMRTKGAYDEYTKARNQYEFLCSRFDKAYRSVLRENARYHHLVMKMLFEEKLITKQSQAESELSGFYAYLMSSEVRELFFNSFEELPAMNKSHSLIYRASKYHEETVIAWIKERTGPNSKLFPKSLMMRKMQQLLKREEANDVNKFNANDKSDEKCLHDEDETDEGAPKAKKARKPTSEEKEERAPTTGTGLQVLKHVNQVPANAVLVVQGKVPSVNELVGKGVSVVIINPIETVSTFKDMCKIAESSSVLRCGEYFKKTFVAAGPLIKTGNAGSRLSASTIPTLLVKLTDGEASRARTPKMRCYTILDLQPTF